MWLSIGPWIIEASFQQLVQQGYVAPMLTKPHWTSFHTGVSSKSKLTEEKVKKGSSP